MTSGPPGFVGRLPLTLKFVLTLAVLVVLIGAAGGKIYLDQKSAALENELALQVVAASKAVERAVKVETKPAALRKAMKFLSVFPYVKCADVFVEDKRLVSWPIPTCKPIVKKYNTRPISVSLDKGRSMILHIDPLHVEKLIETEKWLFVSILSSILLAVSLAITLFLVREVSAPLSRIITALRADDDGQVVSIKDVGGREIKAFVAAYNRLADDVQTKTAEITRWRKRIAAELDQADEVQALLVPPILSKPPIEARNLPLTELSGDFYETHTDDDGNITFLMGDVAGKGIYAAMMLAQTLTAFRASVVADNLNDLVVNMYRYIEDRFPDGLFVALTLARLAADGKTLQLINIGNPDCLVLSADGSHHSVPSAGPAIGILPADIYAMTPVETIDMTDKVIYIFTDGVAEIDLATLSVTDDITNITDDGERLIAYFQSLEQNSGKAGIDILMEQVTAQPQGDDVTIARIGS